MSIMAKNKRIQIIVDVTEEFREELKNVAAGEYRTVAQTILLALVERYPQLAEKLDKR